MLATQVRLHDIADIEGFVAATIKRSGVQVSRDQHEDLLAEGITILYQLAGSFEPQRPGYAQAGRFSGYAARYLPRRLGEAYHRGQLEAQYVTCEDGKREWRYYPKAESLDALFGSTTNDAGYALSGAVEISFRPTSHWASATAVPARA